MNKHKKIDTKFEIEEVESRVEFFFLSGVINQIIGATPYHHGGSDYGDNFLNYCQPPKTACGSSGSYSGGSDFGGFQWWHW